MKKALSLMLALVLVLALCACGGTSAPAATNDTPAAAPANDTPASTPAPAATAAPAAPAAPAATNEPATAAPAEQTWEPKGEFNILIPYAVSSAQDIPFRMMAQYITEKTGINCNIENDETGGGARLAAKLAAAEGDGMTLMITGANKCAQFYQNFWDYTLSDESKVRPVAVAAGPNPYTGTVLCVRNDFPADTWEEFVAYVNEHPGEVTMGVSVGKASEVKNKALFAYFDLNDKVRYVSAGNADMLTGLIGGTIDCGMLTEGTSTSYAVNGDFKIIFNYRVDRNYHGENYHYSQEELDILDNVKILPDIMPEADVEQVYCLFKNYVFVPASTPDYIVEALNEMIESITEVPEWMEQFHALSGGNDFFTSDLSEYPHELDVADAQCKTVYGA